MNGVPINLAFIHKIIDSLGKNSPPEQINVPLQSPRDAIYLRNLTFYLLKLVLTSIGLFNAFFGKKNYIEDSAIHNNLSKIRQNPQH